MDDLKVIVASNLINLRTGAKMTQAELAEKLHYSDKSVSKWERAEAVPDAYILKALSALFGVSVDYLLSPHDQWRAQWQESSTEQKNRRLLTGVVMVAIALVALLVFIVFWMQGEIVWIAFVYALPVALITLLVFHSYWEHGRDNFWIIGALVISAVLTGFCTCYVFGGHLWWQLFLTLPPAELIVFLLSRMRWRH